MTGHGFRAMARTVLDEVLGFRPDFIEHQLAHAVRDPNGRAYNRTAFLPERRRMMQVWADYLDRLRAGKEIDANATVPKPADTFGGPRPCPLISLIAIVQQCEATHTLWNRRRSSADLEQLYSQKQASCLLEAGLKLQRLPENPSRFIAISYGVMENFIRRMSGAPVLRGQPPQFIHRHTTRPPDS